MRLAERQAIGYSRSRVAATALAVALSVCSVKAQQPSTAPASSQHEHAESAPKAQVFGSDAGLVLNFIKPDRTADFEAIMEKLKEALQKSNKPERKSQAASWKVFRAQEPSGNGSVLYVFILDPAVKGADYSVSALLAEVFPLELAELYNRYATSYAGGQNVVNLTLLSALGQ